MNRAAHSREASASARAPLWIAWHLLSALAVALIAGGLRLGAPFWKLEREDQVHLGLIAGVYLAAALALSWKMFRGDRVRLLDALLAVAAGFGMLGLGLLVTGAYTARSVLLIALALSFGFAGLSLFMTSRLFRLAVPAVILSIALLLGFPKGLQLRADSAAVETKTISTAFYNLKLTVYDRSVPSRIAGGGLGLLDDGFLAATGEGALYSLVEDPSTRMVVSRKLPYDIPLNREAFDADVKEEISRSRFRVQGLLVQDLGADVRLLVSHHYWNPENRCFVVRISSMQGAKKALLAGDPSLTWRTLYDTRPCMQIPAIGFGGHESGGRFAALNDREILFSVGDHGIDGWFTDQGIAQSADADYGKTVKIDLETGAAEIYSIGHRNPQGLYRAPDGRIWETEHGPKGGDELNLVERGANYGWPMVTYGTTYEGLTWPLNASQGRHAGYSEPVFSWVPSIGVSNLVTVEKDLFPVWKGDLLVASMRAQTIFRIRVSNGGVQFAEPIAIQTPIRDIKEAPDGRLALLFSNGFGLVEPVISPDADDPPARPERGQILFSACATCHPLSGTEHGVGPNLTGVVGRDVASAPGFAYSEALKKLTGPWTKERLDAFLADPEGYAPGNAMESGGFNDVEDRGVLIEYLATKK